MARNAQRLNFLSRGKDHGSAEGTGGLSPESIGQVGGGAGEIGGAIGPSAGPNEPGTIDPVSVSAKKRGPYKKRTDAERQKARSARRSNHSAETKEKVVVEETIEVEPPAISPTIVAQL